MRLTENALVAQNGDYEDDGYNESQSLLGKLPGTSLYTERPARHFTAEHRGEVKHCKSVICTK